MLPASYELLMDFQKSASRMGVNAKTVLKSFFSRVKCRFITCRTTRLCATGVVLFPEDFDCRYTYVV